MISFLSLQVEQRRQLFEQASVRSGIQTVALEKDWWVTLALKALFNTPYAQHCIFKGGTSLSKVWSLIERFSEDIDIALAPEAFGMDYLSEPSHAYVKQLKRKGCLFTSNELKIALENSFAALGFPASIVFISAAPVPDDMPDRDPQTLFIHSPSLFEENSYIPAEVKMEFGVRSLKEPYSIAQIQSILSSAFPTSLYQEVSFSVAAVEPRKTMLEKMFLLHEKFNRSYSEVLIGDRQSRHLYDLICLLNSPVAPNVLKDTALYQQLLKHRKHYVRSPGLNYDQLINRNLSFVPPAAFLDAFKKDYAAMQSTMIYGNSVDFDAMINLLSDFHARFITQPSLPHHHQ